MERVLKNVFVGFDAVEDHLVEEKVAVWFQVGAGDGQGTGETVTGWRVGGVEKN